MASPRLRDQALEPGRLARFRSWRGARPFWAGCWGMGGGLVILATQPGTFAIFLLPGGARVSALVFGTALAGCGAGLWWKPRHRRPVGVALLLAALGSFLYAAMGGYFIGTSCGIVGASLALAWMPPPPSE